MATWQLNVEDLADTITTTALPFKSINVTWVLNSPGSIDVELNLRDPAITRAALSPGDHQLTLLRDAVKVWGGYLWTHRVNMSQESDHTLNMYGEGYFSRLRHRYITSDLIYNEVNVQQIMWNLINHTQSKSDGDLGINQGSHTGADVTISREYCALEYPNVADSIDEMTLLDDGCDWVIGPCISFANAKGFRTYQPRRGTDVSGSVVLSQTVMSNLQFEIDASPLTNYIYNVGMADCNPPTEITYAGASLSSYKLMEGVQDIDAAYKHDLIAHGQEYLRNYKNPVWRATATYFSTKGPAWGAFDVGDIVMVSSNIGFSTFPSQKMRVTSIQLTIVPAQPELWTVTLDSVID